MGRKQESIVPASGRFRRAIAAISSALLIAAGLVVVSTPSSAEALDFDQFNRGNIITDANFYDGDAMTEAQIQAFLDTMIGTCQTTYCLNIYTQTTTDRPKDRTVCDAYAGAPNELASRIIYKVQKACGISAKVILVTLQKEQGLVQKKNPTAGTLERAMGYGCPDSTGGTCNANFYGFFNQVYWGSWQFKRYSTPDIWGTYYAGKTFNVKTHPNSSCPAISVYIANRATAALYNYTPYTPNNAALAAWPAASTDPCASYGNRNFWGYYYSWFGSPTDIHPTGVEVDRLGGADRFQTAVQIAQAAFPESGVPVVYLADGTNYPDALSAAPAAALTGGPLLLSRPDVLPVVTRDEIIRLAPARIVVVGLQGSISDSVFEELNALAPTERIGGVDRYETSRLVAQETFPAGSTAYAFIATGTTFPDALSASAAAGAIGAPVILVRGTETELDQETIDLLQTLGVSVVYITGGSGVVTSELETALAEVPGVSSVIRYGGADRYETSAMTNRASFNTSERVFLASGSDFPDALAGAAFAGMVKAPLYLTKKDCVYTRVFEDFQTLGTSKMTIIGGTGIVGSGVSNFVNCH